MQRILQVGNRFPRSVLFLLTAVTILSFFHLPNLSLEITAEGMMVRDDPARLFYEKTLATFGSDSITIIYLEDDDLFNRENLLTIQEVVAQLEKSPLIDHTVSLFSIRHIYTKDEVTYTAPYLKPVPKSQTALNDIKQLAPLNPMVAGNLVSDDGRAMAINVYLDTSKYERGFDEQVDAELKKIIQPLKGRLSNVFYLGDPYVRVGLSDRIKQDQEAIIPSAVLLLVLTLAVVLRQLQAALIPLITAGVSIIWTLGLMAALEIPVNVMTSIIPALLIIIGSTEDIHLLSEYRSGLALGFSRKEAQERMAKNMGLAIVLTFTTTYLGFLSISISKLDLLMEFGIIASTGLLFNFLATVLFIPAILKLLKLQRSPQSESKYATVFQQFALMMLMLTSKFRGAVVTALTVIVTTALYMASHISVNNNVIDYFDEDSQLVRYANTLHQNLSGIQNFSIVLTGKEDDFLKLENIRQIKKFQDYLRDSGYIDRSYSFADFISVIHGGLNSETEGVFGLPENDDIVEAYMSLMEEGVAKGFVSSDYSQAKILARHNISSSEELNDVVKAIEKYAALQISADLDLKVTGENYLNNKAVDYMAKGQLYSLILIMSVIFLIVSILFMNIIAGLIAVLANLFPIISLFGVMGWLEIPVNTGTAMVAAISLGVCVDYSMHFMVRYNRLSRLGKHGDKPIIETTREEAVPIVSTALALAAGFLTLSLSDFPPVARFGQLSALVMLLAVISTFMLTAMILQYVRLLSVWDFLSTRLKQEVLDASPLFQNMSRWQARKLIALSEIQTYVQDEAFVLQGQSLNDLYVLLDGQIESWRTRADGSTYIDNTQQAGAVFGTLFPDVGERSPTDMVAIEPSSVLVLKWDDLQGISRSYPRLASQLFRNISATMGALQQVRERRHLQSKDELSGGYSKTIFLQMLKHMVKQAHRWDEELSVICIKMETANSLPIHDLHLNVRRMGIIIRSCMRSTDVFSRVEDLSFQLACLKLTAQDAAGLAHRILRECDEQCGNNKPGVKVDFNIFTLRIDEPTERFIEKVERNHVSPISESKKSAVKVGESFL